MSRAWCLLTVLAVCFACYGCGAATAAEGRATEASTPAPQTEAVTPAQSVGHTLHAIGHPVVLVTSNNFYLLIRLREQLALFRSGGVAATFFVDGQSGADGVSQIGSVRRHCYRSSQRRWTSARSSQPGRLRHSCPTQLRV